MIVKDNFEQQNALWKKKKINFGNLLVSLWETNIERKNHLIAEHWIFYEKESVCNHYIVNKSPVK